jgi:hypothetical protein
MKVSELNKKRILVIGVIFLSLSGCEKKEPTPSTSVESIAKARGIDQAWLVDKDNRLAIVDIDRGEVIPSCEDREKSKGGEADRFGPCKARIKCTSKTEGSSPDCILVDAKTQEPLPADRIIAKEPFFKFQYKGTICKQTGGTQGGTEICCPPHSMSRCQ